MVALVDLDQFKPVNDRYGHHVGDLVLIEAARRLTAVVGPHGLVARLGGDEFAIALNTTNGFEAVLSQVVSTLAAPMMIEGRALTVSASVGVAVVRDITGLDPSTRDSGAAGGVLSWFSSALHAADVAMYRAKGTRDHIATHDPEQRHPLGHQQR